MKSPRNEAGGASEPPEDAADNSSTSPASATEPVAEDPSPVKGQRNDDSKPGEQMSIPGIGDDVEDADALWELNSPSALAQLASKGDFSADQLRALVGLPSSRNRVGGLFRRAKRDGLIVEVAATTSAAASRRGGLVRIWRAAA